jgi:hypothetical protein
VPQSGVSNGLKLAWDEGWADYFAVSSQLLLPPQESGIPNVGDHNYDDLHEANPDDSFSFSLDTLAQDKNAVGEDNQGSVTGVLWNMLLTSQGGSGPLNYTDKSIFDLINESKPMTVGALWNAAAARLDNEGRTQLGEIFANMKIAPDPTGPDEGYSAKVSDPPPIFTWNRNGVDGDPAAGNGGKTNENDDFTIQFFSSDYSQVVFEAPKSEITLNADTARFQPTADEWKWIISSGADIRWVVEGKNTVFATPGGALGRYWGPARTILGGEG